MRLYGFFFAERVRAMYPTISKARPMEKVVKYQERWRRSWKMWMQASRAKMMTPRTASANEGV